MSTWAMEDINVGELIDRAEKEGPQMVTRQGVETAVVVPLAEWRRMKGRTKPSMTDVLFAPTPRFDDDPFPRIRDLKLGPPPEFD